MVKQYIHTCLKNQQYPCVSEKAFVGVIFHIAKASKYLQCFTYARPSTFRAEHLLLNSILITMFHTVHTDDIALLLCLKLDLWKDCDITATSPHSKGPSLGDL